MGTKNKIITLPDDSIKILAALAKADGRSFKNYAERVLIGWANDNEKTIKNLKNGNKQPPSITSKTSNKHSRGSE